MERLKSIAATWWEPFGDRHEQPDLFCCPSRETGIPTGAMDPSLRVPTDGCRPLVEVYPRVKGAIVCMVTAAHVCGLLPGPPSTLWLGAPQRVHVPKLGPAILRTLRWSNRQAFEVGVAAAKVHDVVVLCTCPERTIVDLVRYARHVDGTGMAVRCLRAYGASGGSREAIRYTADALRIPRAAGLVLDALLAGTELRR